MCVPARLPRFVLGAAGRSIDQLLAQLRKEPANEEECAAKFMLYDACRQVWQGNGMKRPCLAGIGLRYFNLR